MTDTVLRFTFSTLRSSHGAASSFGMNRINFNGFSFPLGTNGAALSVASANLAKLLHLSGPGLPLAPVAVPANTSVSYAIVYEGIEASGAGVAFTLSCHLSSCLMAEANLPD